MRHVEETQLEDAVQTAHIAVPDANGPQEEAPAGMVSPLAGSLLANREGLARLNPRLNRLARALRSERRRGLAGHWSYDLARHHALLQAFKAELKDWRRRSAAPERGNEPQGKSAVVATWERDGDEARRR